MLVTSFPSLHYYNQLSIIDSGLGWTSSLCYIQSSLALILSTVRFWPPKIIGREVLFKKVWIKKLFADMLRSWELQN